MAATDLDLDALLDALQARARQRAEAVELRNAAGDVVTPRASTGRLTVNPGDVIASVWGNTTYDQTIQAFDTPAARDAQWPTPKDGAAAYTADTGALWVRRAGAWVSPPRGLVGVATGPAAQTDVSAQTVMVSLTVPLVAGRRYRATAQTWTIQQTSTGNPIAMFADTLALLPPSGSLRLMSLVGVAASGGAPGAGSWTFTAAASGNDTFNLTGQTSAGTLRFPANSSQITVTDIGA